MRGAAEIASSTGGLAEIVRDGETGLLVGRGEVNSLASALRQLLLNCNKARALGAAGRCVAMAEYTESLCCDRFESVHKSLIAEQMNCGRSNTLVTTPMFLNR